MKRAVILHGTDGNPGENWYPWMKAQLEARGYEVWIPQLPDAHTPSTRSWTKFLLDSGYDFQDSLLIGHSAGAVEILHLLQNLSKQTQVRTAVLVSAFSWEQVNDPKWAKVREVFESQLKDIFEDPFDFVKITTKAQNFLFIHGGNDPYCDPKYAREMAEKLGGEYVEVPGGQHFSAGTDPSYKKFPKLIELLEERGLLA